MLEWKNFCENEESTWPEDGQLVLVKTANNNLYVARFSIAAIRWPSFSVKVDEKDSLKNCYDAWGTCIDAEVVRSWSLIPAYLQGVYYDLVR